MVLNHPGIISVHLSSLSRGKKTPKNWTHEEGYFETKTEAADYILDYVCNSYLDPTENNPLVPLPAVSLRYNRLESDTDPFFLDFPFKMVENRCSRCHRYKKDPPSPDLGHEGSQAESKCKLEHHPFPCDHIGEDDKVCEFHVDEGDEREHAAADIGALAQEFEGRFHAQSAEINDLKKHMLDIK